MEITKAIIPVAGWGTRMLPITKAIEKCMLPVGKRPIIDYVVQDCLAAGIREFIFVVSEQSSQLEAYYRSNIHLNDYLRRKGKEDMLPLIAPLKANMHFVTQPSYRRRVSAAYWQKKYRTKVLAATVRLSLMRADIFAKLLRNHALKKRRAITLISANMF